MLPNEARTRPEQAAPGNSDATGRARLRRNRALAGGLLVGMGGMFLLTHLVPDPGFGTGLLRAGAEAGLVGGIADWFAVTALFRHPLGLPIPHTAIIPRNQERIGRTLGRFVERHFLTEDVLLRKLRGAGIGARFSAWLAAPQTAATIVGPASTALIHLVRSLENRELQDLANRTLGEYLRRADMAPVLGRAINLLGASGEADAIFERVIEAGLRLLHENRAKVERMVEEHSRWWVPRSVDRRIAAAIMRDLTAILQSLRQPDSRARQHFREALARLVDDLVNDPAQRAQVDAAKNRLLQHPELQAWLGSIWRTLSRASLAELEDPGSRTRRALETGITLTGEALRADPAMQRQLDRLVEHAAQFLVSWRGEIGGFIAEVVKSWDTTTLIDRLELAVGSDLQYIRMNGTVVGACVGCLIYVGSVLLP